MRVRTPTACLHCGITKQRHARWWFGQGLAATRWTEGVGWHHWTMPDDATILRRMKDRRTNPTRWLPANDMRVTYRKWKQ